MASGLFADERKAIESRFAAAWTTTPIQWTNVPFSQPSTPWVRLTLQRANGGRMTLGPTPHRQFPGTVAISIFVPENTAQQTVLQYADTIAAIFRDQAFACGSTGIITCRDINLHDNGTEEGWYSLVVLVDFVRDDNF